MQYVSEKYADLTYELIKKLWSYAEIRYEEVQSVAALTGALADAGFAVETGIAGMPTAFRAVYGADPADGRVPVIGLLAEYDALDGLSQQADCTEDMPRTETTHGHGCGHHLIGSGIVCAALVLRDYIDEHPGCCRLVVLGCPAEEGGCGKTYMARAGVFDELDVALTWHPGTQNAAMTGSLLANIQLAFRFHGKSSHAGAAPHLGRSALDAVELMDVGGNYMREQMEMTDRIHYAITNSGGISPNVVQPEAEVVYLIRSRTNETVQKLLHRVQNIARGAALMTETTVDWEIISGVSNVVPSDTLGQLMYDKMAELGVPHYTEEEKAYIGRFREVIGDEAAVHDLGMLPEFDLPLREELCRTHPMGDFIIPFSPKDVIETASSDMGDVSQIVPMLQLQIACFCLGTPPHSKLQVAQGMSSYALKGTLFAAQTIAESAKALIEDPALLAKAKEENSRRTGGAKYVCPLPEDVLPLPFRTGKAVR